MMMPSRNQLVPVLGSEPPQRFAANAVGPAHPDELITVTVKVRAKDDKSTDAAEPPKKQAPVRREDFAAAHGADPATLKKIEDYATSKGLKVVESWGAKRCGILAGTVSNFETAFDVKLERFAHPGGTFRSHSTPVNVPADLQKDVEAVLGLSNRPVAKPHFQMRKKMIASAKALSSARPQPMTPLDVARLYDFPASLDGTGQCIAIIELGGGYVPADLQTYFNAIKVPLPDVLDVSVAGGTNSPGQDADGEVMLDIEVAGAVAPKARIVVYFAPNTDQGFVQAITDAAHDKVSKPSVISISWGGPEVAWRKSARTAMNNAIRDATMMGVTVTVASGDNGSADGVTDGHVHVDFPASSPFSLACGGTRLIGSGSTISSETVWNDGPDSATGGGVSDAFPIPSYQSGAHVPKSKNKGYAGRGVPDVAGNADPNSGYEVRVDGSDTVVGGTSAVAPLWAGLIALINQHLGKPVGFINPQLYSSVASSGAFHQITHGNNGAFSAGAGWNACTGLGTPDGTEILSALTPSGTPTPAPTPAPPAKSKTVTA
jgi:kumamolisin